jgi:hypothetical protein
MDVVISNVDICIVIFSNFNDLEAFPCRMVHSVWKQAIDYTHYTEYLKQFSSYINGLIVRRPITQYNVSKMKWYASNPGYNYAFDSSRHELHYPRRRNNGEDRRCCAFTRTGRRCSRPYTQPTRMCLIHHRCIPYSMAIMEWNMSPRNVNPFL